MDITTLLIVWLVTAVSLWIISKLPIWSAILGAFALTLVNNIIYKLLGV